MVHIFYFIQSIMLEKNSEPKKKLMDFFFPRRPKYHVAAEYKITRI